MRRVAIAALAMLLMISAQTLPAGAKKMGMKLISGDVNSARTDKLSHEITWNHSLAAAEAQAKRQGKMIFWVQMLGDMTGAT